MTYSTNKLTTTADCEKAITLAQDLKEDIIYEQSRANRQLSEQAKTTASATANLAVITAQIAGAEAGLAYLEDGETKVTEQSRIRRLNDRKDNLADTLRKNSAANVLDAELKASLLDLQITEIDAYITAVNTRKAAI
jgi:hypothetical protein